MLTIDIISGNKDGSLIFNVDGHPNNGKSQAEKGTKVQWKVRQGSNVSYIHSIKQKIKNGKPVGTDIFSADPPKAQGANSKLWMGKINSDATDYTEYIYDIEWKHEEVKDIICCDPIIAIKPTPAPPVLKIIIGILLGLFALFSLNLLRRKNQHIK